MSDASQDVPETATEAEEHETDMELLDKEEAKDATVVEATPDPLPPLEELATGGHWKQKGVLETCLAELRELDTPADVLRLVNQAYGALVRRG